MNAFEYVTAETYEAAVAFLAKPGRPGETLLKAGGIDVLDRLKERLETPQRLLNIRPLHDPVDTIKARPTEQLVVINALTTLSELAEHKGTGERLPALAEAAASAATPQIRNLATVGGNLCQKPRCWYYRSHDYQCLKKGGGTCYAVSGDNRYHAIFGAGACHIVHPSNLAPALLAYGAQVRLIRHQNGTQQERVVDLEQFYRVPPNPVQDEHTLEPGELLKEMLIALDNTGPRAAYVEVREKQSFDWPLVSCAVNLNKPDQPRVMFGAVAPIPWRMKSVEQVLAGRELTDTVIADAKAKAVVGAAPMTRNAYKVRLIGAVLADALRTAAGRAAGGR